MKKSMSFAAVALMALAACVTSCGGTKEETVAQTITTTPTSAVMYVDSTLQLKATVEPAEAKVTWESEDMNTAMVDANGLVTAKAAGEVKIFAVSGTMRAATKIQIFNNPVSLQLEMLDIAQKKCTVAVTPSDEEGYYYCGYADKATLGNITDAELAENVMTNLKAMAKQYAAYGYTLKNFLQQGTKNLIASSLTASTDYVMFAFGVDVENEMAGTVVTRAEFRTKDVVPSNMTITLQFDSVSYVTNSKGVVDTLIYFSAHPSTDNETYLLGGAEKGYLTESFGGDPKTYMKNMEANYDKKGTLEKYLRKGVFSIYAKNPEDNSQWVIIAAGYDGGFSTKMFTLEYTYIAPKSGKPARLVPRVQNDEVLEVEADLQPIHYIPGMCH